MARAALLGARGNSGVILSQIVRGAAEELASRPGELVDPVLVAAAFARAADAAYESVRDPAEGTMLTAVRAMAHRVAQDLAHMDTPRLGPDVDPREQDELLAEVLERALEAGKEAVQRGPDQLAVLREAGVVDAGAYGLTVIMAGVVARAARRRPPPEIAHERARARAAPAPARVERATASAPTSRSPARGSRAPTSCRGSSSSATRCSWSATSRRCACTCTPTIPTRAVALFDGRPARCPASTSPTCASRSPSATPGCRPRDDGNGHGRAPPAGWWRWPAARGSCASTAELGAHVVEGGATLNPSTYELLAGIHAVDARRGDRAAQQPERDPRGRARRGAVGAARAGVVPTRAQQSGPGGAARLRLVARRWTRTPRPWARPLTALRTGGVAPAARDDGQGRFQRGRRRRLRRRGPGRLGRAARGARGRRSSAVADGCEVLTVPRRARARRSARTSVADAACPTALELDYHHGGQAAWWYLLAAE